MPDSNENPFEELPEALVDEMLARSEQVGDALYQSFEEVQSQRQVLRGTLGNRGLLGRDTELGYPPIPTTCGSDGSYVIEKLLATDLVAMASVAVEGLTPPSETRHWERPHHISLIEPIPHDPDTGTIARAIMMSMELELAHKAPHDVVFLDGSLTTPLIYLNQALGKIAENPDSKLRDQLLDRLEEALSAYKVILLASRTDKVWCGVPKYTTRRELGKQMGWPENYDDRALLTLILQSGEFIKPFPLEQPSERWHLKLSHSPKGEALEPLKDEVISALECLFAVYYRPHNWMPVLRLEVSSSIAQNQHRLAVLLQGIKHQCSTPSILEPFPLYMADRMVKHLGRAIPALRQVATQCMANQYEGEIGEIFFNMHGYRTETGR